MIALSRSPFHRSFVRCVVRSVSRMGCAGVALILLAPRSSPAEPEPLRYAIFQRVSWSVGADVGDCRTHGTMVAVRQEADGELQYRTWIQGTTTSGKDAGEKKEARAVVEMRRDPQTQRVRYTTPGFALLEQAINQTVAQVARGERTEGRWEETIRLDIPVPIFPRELKVQLDVRPIQLAENTPAICIRGMIEKFTTPAMKPGGHVEGDMVGHYRFVYVYSPRGHELYQSGAILAVFHEGGQTRIGSTCLAVDAKGQPLHPLLDLREELGLAKPAGVVERAAREMPLPVAQALKLEPMLAAVAMTSAERATNPVAVPLIGSLVFANSIVGYFDASPIEKWVDDYAVAHGGEAGQLAAIYNTATIGLGVVFPAPLPPVIVAIATAYGVYQLYDSMIQRSAAAHMAQVQQPVKPFKWKQPSLAQADRVLPTRPMPGGEIWDGSAPASRPVNIGGGGSSGAGTTPTGVGGGITPTGGMPPSGPVAFEKGLALRQAEHLAGMQIEEIAVPDPGTGMPVESGVTGQPSQTGEISGGETIGEAPPDAGTAGGETAGDTPAEPPDSSLADSGMDPGSGSSTGAGTSGTGGTPPASGSFTATPSTLGTTGAEFNPITVDGAVPQGGVGLHQGPPDTPPPPNPSSGVNPAIIVAGVAGGAAVVAGTVALATGGGLGGTSYRCSEGYSYCPHVSKCCPSGYIRGAWGAYYIPGRGCYKSAESAVQAQIRYRIAKTPYPCVDERRNK